jgi:prepilin-type N-terminal cleavage/methylation domain-containing protein
MPDAQNHASRPIRGQNQTTKTRLAQSQIAQKPSIERHGFTLVEIMIVVTIIALLAAIALPSFLRARERSQATHILQDLRVLNAAVDQYAIDYSKASGQKYAWSDIQAYIKTGTLLYDSFPANGRTPPDLLGNRYRCTKIIDQTYPDCGDVALNPITFSVLSDVTPLDFWSPFGVQGY